MKKVTLICVLLLSVAILFAGSLSFNISKAASLQRSSSSAAQSSTTSTTQVLSNPSAKTAKPSTLSANQLSRRQAYSGPFYSSSRSQNKKYHYPGCFEVANIDAENLIKFDSVQNACASGYMPCCRCNPPACNGAMYQMT